MKFRTVRIFDGSEHQVPERIQRLDSRNTHGWQLRYGRGKEKTDRKCFPKYAVFEYSLIFAIRKAEAALSEETPLK